MVMALAKQEKLYSKCHFPIVIYKTCLSNGIIEVNKVLDV